MAELMDNHSRLKKKLQLLQEMVLFEILSLHHLQHQLNYKIYAGSQNPIQASITYGDRTSKTIEF